MKKLAVAGIVLFSIGLVVIQNKTLGLPTIAGFMMLLSVYGLLFTAIVLTNNHNNKTNKLRNSESIGCLLLFALHAVTGVIYLRTNPDTIVDYSNLTALVGLAYSIWMLRGITALRKKQEVNKTLRDSETVPSSVKQTISPRPTSASPSRRP